MAATEQTKIIKSFYGGITRDDKSKINGVASNIEELDIFSNADYIQAEQIFTADTFPASSEVYSYTSGADGTAYAYGRETAASKVRIFSVASGGAAAPGAWATLFTSADATNLGTITSPIQFFRTTESPTDYLYYITNGSGVITLKRYSITGAAESTVGTLTGLNGAFDRISMKVIFGELFVTNGKYIAKVDKDGVFTNDAFLLPLEWTSVDIVAVSDVAIILARYTDRTVNFSKCFWWDLTETAQFDDSFEIPCGGPQWMVNHKETIKIFCAINGVGRFFQLSGAFPGAVPLELPGMVLTNVADEATTQPISSSKMVATKDKILYFGLYKTDKTGVYAIGQLDQDKPTALILSKRFNTTSYALHKPVGLMIQGSNFYAAYVDNGTSGTARCATLNTPNRSTSGVYESVVIDLGDATLDKDLTNIFITSQPIPASSDVNVSTTKNYGSYTEIFRGDGTSLNTTSAVQGMFLSKHTSKAKTFKIKVELVSNGANSPKVTGIGFRCRVEDKPAAE